MKRAVQANAYCECGGDDERGGVVGRGEGAETERKEGGEEGVEESAGEDVDEEVEGQESVCGGGARRWVQFVAALDDGWGGGHADGKGNVSLTWGM